MKKGTCLGLVLGAALAVAWGGMAPAMADYVDAVNALSPDHYYQLNETSQGVVYDSGTGSVNGNHSGTFGTGAAEAGVAGVDLPGFDAGNKALWANDSGAVNLGSSTPFAASTMTVALWYRNPLPTSTDGISDRLFQNNSSTAPLTIASSDGGTIHVATGAEVENSVQMSRENLWIINNTWHHVVVVRNGDDAANLDVYVDGVDRSSLFAADPHAWGSTGSNAWIAARDVPNEEGLLHGAVDEVAIWNNRALTEAEVQNLWDTAVGTAPTYTGYVGAVLDTNPIAYYRFEEDAGLVGGDVVQNYVHADSQTVTLGPGTVGYSAQYPDSAPTLGGDGIQPTETLGGNAVDGLASGNRAAQFFGNDPAGDGVADMIHIGGNPAWASEEKTYSLLFKTDTEERWIRLIASDPKTEDDLYLIMDEGKLIVVGNRDGSVVGDTSGTFNDGQWHHATVVRSGDTLTDLKLFIDGAATTLNDRAGSGWTAPSSGRIGARGTTATGFRGLMDEVSIWDRALSDTEALALFDALVDISAGLEGDLNSDGFVGGDDLDIVRSFWGQSVPAGDLESGDPSGDGFVGGDDLDIVRANWGQGSPPAPTAVPEPSSLILLLLGTLAGLALHFGRGGRKS